MFMLEVLNPVRVESSKDSNQPPYRPRLPILRPRVDCTNECLLTWFYDIWAFFHCSIVDFDRWLGTWTLINSVMSHADVWNMVKTQAVCLLIVSLPSCCDFSRITYHKTQRSKAGSWGQVYVRLAGSWKIATTFTEPAHQIRIDTLLSSSGQTGWGS